MNVRSTKDHLRAVGAAMLKEPGGILDKLAYGYWYLTGEKPNQSNIQPKEPAAVFPGIALPWASCAFATLEPSARLCASLMATNVSREAVEDLRPPWEAFAVDIPAGLLGDSPECVIVSPAFPRGFNLHAVCDLGIVQSGIDDLADLADVRADTLELEEGFPNIDDGVRRRIEMISRLVVNLCLELDRAQFRREAQAAGPVKYKNGNPVSHVFKVTRPVVLDIRSDVRNYVCGIRGSSPVVRTLVRGHWKMQPHG